jgi:UDP-glucose 4-epimerase
MEGEQPTPIICDISDYHEVEKVIKRKYDIIFHCAGYSGQINTQKEPYSSYVNNVVGTINVLENIRKYAPASKIVLIGSRLEYGKPQYIPVDENHPTNPTSQYGMDKLTAAHYALWYWKMYGIRVTILRLSNIYGPHKLFNFKLYNTLNYFIDRAYMGKKLIVYGKGTQLRDYLYIEDLIQIMLNVGLNREADGQIFNIGYGKPIKFIDAIQYIAKVFNVKVTRQQWPSGHEQYETGSYVSNIRKIISCTDWAPTTNFHKGILLCKESYHS